MSSECEISMKGKNNTTDMFVEEGEWNTDIRDPVYAEVNTENTSPTTEGEDSGQRSLNENSSLTQTGARLENDGRSRKYFITLIFIVTTVSILFVIIILLAVMYIQISALRSSLGSSNHTNSISMLELENIKEELLSVNLSMEQLSYKLSTLSANTTLVLARQRDMLESTAIASSCAEILAQAPMAESGYYTVRSSTGQLRQVYCNMRLNCGGLSGGWMKIAVLKSCPEGFNNLTFNGSNVCVRREHVAGCSAINYSTLNIQYSHVCGQVRAYENGFLNGFYNSSSGGLKSENISERYLDGVSLTSSGKHIWSFVAGACNCSRPRPAFVGEDWTCDEIEPGRIAPSGSILWDTHKCGRYLPLFHKQLEHTIASDIQLSVCHEEKGALLIKAVDIFVY